MKLLMISLGCDKNLTNTEEMMGLLDKEGYSFTDNEEEAEVIIVNSCCFIGDAKEESINTILQMAEYKVEKGGKCKVLAVCGCLAQRYADEIRKEIPEVDAVIGTSAYEEIDFAIKRALGDEDKSAGLDETQNNEAKSSGIYLKDLSYLPDVKAQRLITTGGHFAYLKIAEGCNKHCTYCIIPKLRGTYRSVPMDRLIAEAKSLAKRGVKEIILVAQETTLYGVDLYGEKKLPELLHKLNEIEELSWIRLLYAYPEEITDELIDAISECDKVCNYIDMPVQSGSDEVLRKMGRVTTAEKITDTVNRLRSKIPDICIRTTFITGFPGETEENHEETMQFVNDLEFDRVGVFTYSMEEDTPAAEFEDQIDEKIKEARRTDIMELQQEIVFEKNENLAGTVLEAFVEGKITATADDEYPSDDDFDGNIYVARTYMDAPSVDGFIFIQTYRELISGDIVKVKVTGASEYDLIGEIED